MSGVAGATPIDSPAPTGESAPDTVTPSVADIGELVRGNVIGEIYGARGSNSVPLNRDGTVKRKPGRPSNASRGLPGTPAKSEPEKRSARISSTEASRAIVNLSNSFLVGALGDEWQFDSQAECDGMREAVAAYVEAKSDGTMSPDALLALVVAGYAAPRVTRPVTRGKIRTFLARVWDRLAPKKSGLL